MPDGQVEQAGIAETPGLGAIGGHHDFRDDALRKPDAEPDAEIGGIVDEQRRGVRGRGRIGVGGGVEGAVERGAVRGEDAAADVGERVDGGGGGEGRVGVVLLPDDREAGGIVHGEAGHEAGAIRRHGDDGALPGGGAVAQDHTGGDFVDEDVRVGVGGGDDADDEAAIGRAHQLAGEGGGGAGEALRGSGGEGGGEGGNRYRDQLLAGDLAAVEDGERALRDAVDDAAADHGDERSPIGADFDALRSGGELHGLDDSIDGEIDDVERRAAAGGDVEPAAIHRDGAGERGAAGGDAADDLVAGVIEDQHLVGFVLDEVEDVTKLVEDDIAGSAAGEGEDVTESRADRRLRMGRLPRGQNQTQYRYTFKTPVVHKH